METCILDIKSIKNTHSAYFPCLIAICFPFRKNMQFKLAACLKKWPTLLDPLRTLGKNLIDSDSF